MVDSTTSDKSEALLARASIDVLTRLRDAAAQAIVEDVARAAEISPLGLKRLVTIRLNETISTVRDHLTFQVPSAEETPVPTQANPIATLTPMSMCPKCGSVRQVEPSEASTVQTCGLDSCATAEDSQSWGKNALALAKLHKIAERHYVPDETEARLEAAVGEDLDHLAVELVGPVWARSRNVIAHESDKSLRDAIRNHLQTHWRTKDGLELPFQWIKFESVRDFLLLDGKSRAAVPRLRVLAMLAGAQRLLLSQPLPVWQVDNRPNAGSLERAIVLA